MSAAPAEALAAAFVRSRDMDAALGERLEAYSNAVREFISAYAEAVDQLVSRLSSSGAGLEAPRPGEPMPPFVVIPSFLTGRGSRSGRSTHRS
jgi:hypothetical protein